MKSWTSRAGAQAVIQPIESNWVDPLLYVLADLFCNILSATITIKEAQERTGRYKI